MEGIRRRYLLTAKLSGRQRPAAGETRATKPDARRQTLARQGSADAASFPTRYGARGLPRDESRQTARTAAEIFSRACSIIGRGAPRFMRM